MKHFQTAIISLISAVFCTALAVSVHAGASDTSPDSFTEAPPEIPAYHMFIPDDFTDAPGELPETMLSSDDYTDAPSEIPETIFLVSGDDFADAPSEIPENIIPESEEEFADAPDEISEDMAVELADPPELMPDEPATDAEFSEAPEMLPQDIPPQEEIIEFTTEALYETISLTENQIEFVPDELILSESKITVPTEYFIDAPEFFPIYSDFST